MAGIVDLTATAKPVVLVDSSGNPVTGGGDASAANQATEIARLDSILAKLSADPATQTTLAAILAKLIAAPATAANQATEIAGLSSIDGHVDGIEGLLVALAAQLPASLAPKTPALSLSTVPAVLSCATVAAGSTTTAFGATGAAGDYLSHVILEPAATNAGTTTIFNDATEVYKYTAGTLADLRPILIPINMVSVGGAWKVTTGASMQARGFGTFTA